jgi:hypothetical protein
MSSHLPVSSRNTVHMTVGNTQFLERIGGDCAPGD